MNIHRTVYREDHEMLRDTARRFFERECLPRQAEWDQAGRTDRETWLKAGREGLLCVTVPTEYGGGGGDFGHACVLAEELHKSGVSGFSLSVHSDITAPYIVRFGTEAQKQRWLPGICSGETIMAIAMTVSSRNQAAGFLSAASDVSPPAGLCPASAARAVRA
ncbi:Acyl-CoA dehydrogenase [compost metagenome]